MYFIMELVLIRHIRWHKYYSVFVPGLFFICEVAVNVI